mgnify:CR=1 FL=1
MIGDQRGALAGRLFLDLVGQGFGAGGRVSDGAYGWGGAAGTVALVSYKVGLRANLMTQYMPSEAYPVHDAFPKAVLEDLAVMQGAKS